MSIAILIIVCVILVVNLGSLYLVSEWFKEVLAQPHLMVSEPLVKVPPGLDEDSVIIMDDEHEESVLKKQEKPAL